MCSTYVIAYICNECIGFQIVTKSEMIHCCLYEQIEEEFYPFEFNKDTKVIKIYRDLDKYYKNTYKYRKYNASNIINNDDTHIILDINELIENGNLEFI